MYVCKYMYVCMYIYIYIYAKVYIDIYCTPVQLHGNRLYIIVLKKNYNIIDHIFNKIIITHGLKQSFHSQHKCR